MGRIQRWPVMIGIIYGVFVLVLVGFVIFSSFNTVDLVSHDYYRQEIAYQDQIDRIKRTKQLEQPLAWQYDREKKLIVFQFPDSLETGKIRGTIHFFRPSDATRDRVAEIRPDASNRQIFSTSEISDGFWRIKLSWKYDNQEYFDEFAVYIK
jgi:hypothetical protein